ncbi:MAG: hypothetical protein IKR57_03395 [Bacilli bacterium]|nr:hypothetical protein [Bacilli bacterium]
MNKYKISIIFASIGIILVCLLMILSTYAYFTVDVEGEGEDISLKAFNDNTDVIYNDTSNVSLVNAYTGDEIIKTFTVENTSDYLIYYDILLEDVVNNFENKDDLVYELSSDNNGAIRNETILPSSDTYIASKIKLPKGVKHSYQLKITFLKTNNDQSNNMNKTFSSKIRILPTNGINVGEQIYKNNTLGKKIEDSLDNINVLYTNSSINGVTIYYYKGNNELNNNVIFDNSCYKIIRTTEDNGIRLIYNGKYENQECGNKILEEKSVFNSKTNYNAYIGYMYGDANSNNYNDEHKNITTSIIKSNVEKWYSENVKSTNLVSSSSIYCNNRKTTEFTLKNVLYSTLGYGSNNSGYYNNINNNYTFDCYNINDRLTISSVNGSKVLNHPVGLITADELLLIGIGNDSYLYSNDEYWTMSPAYYNASGAYNYSVNQSSLVARKVDTELGVRPVITLNKDVKIKSGDGSNINPYILE